MAKLNIGDIAPSFEAINQDGVVVKSSDFNKLILYFYPKDNTPGCTTEACSLRDGYAELKKMGFEILGVSPDSEKRHQGFIEKHTLPFQLIADCDRKLAESYGVWALKKFMGRESMGIVRTTFIIENGVVSSIIEKVKTKDHANQILEIIK